MKYVKVVPVSLCDEKEWMPMKLTIIIPTYNSKRYIPLLHRDLRVFLADPDVEIIIVDDASTDGSQALLRRFFAAEKNVVLRLQSQNAGQSHSRHLALKEASGDYVYFMDSDDRLKSDFHRVVLPLTRQSQADVIFFDYKAWMHRVSIGKKSRLISVEDALTTVLELKGKRSSAGYLWNKLFKRSLINEMAFKETLFEDLDFCIRAVLKARTFQYVHAAGYHYMFHLKSSFNGAFISRCDKLVHDRITVQEAVMGYLSAARQTFDFEALKKPLMRYNLNIVGWLLMISLGRVKDKAVIQRVYDFYRVHRPDFPMGRARWIVILFKWHGINDVSSLKNDYQA